MVHVRVKKDIMKTKLESVKNAIIRAKTAKEDLI